MTILKNFFWYKKIIIDIFIYISIIFFLFSINLFINKNYINKYEIFFDNFIFVDNNLSYLKSFKYRLISNDNVDIIKKFNFITNKLDQYTCLDNINIKNNISSFKNFFPHFVSDRHFFPERILDGPFKKYFNNTIYSQLHKPIQYSEGGKLYLEIRTSLPRTSNTYFLYIMAKRNMERLFNIHYEIDPPLKYNPVEKKDFLNNKIYFYLKNEKYINDQDYLVSKKSINYKNKIYFKTINHYDLLYLNDGSFNDFIIDNKIFDTNRKHLNECLILNRNLSKIFNQLNFSQNIDTKYKISFHSSYYENNNQNLNKIIVIFFSLLIFLIYKIKF